MPCAGTGSPTEPQIESDEAAPPEVSQKSESKAAWSNIVTGATVNPVNLRTTSVNFLECPLVVRDRAGPQSLEV